MSGRTTSSAMIKINNVTYDVGLTDDDVAGIMWYFRCNARIRLFWTKQDLTAHVRKIQNKIVKREMLAMISKLHGRAVCYAR